MKITKTMVRKPYEKEAKVVLHTDGSVFQKKWTEDQLLDVFMFANPDKSQDNEDAFLRFLKLLVWLETIQ